MASIQDSIYIGGTYYPIALVPSAFEKAGMVSDSSILSPSQNFCEVSGAVSKYVKNGSMHISTFCARFYEKTESGQNRPIDFSFSGPCISLDFKAQWYDNEQQDEAIERICIATSLACQIIANSR